MASEAGEAGGGGTFYQMTPTGKYEALYNFCSYTDVSCTSGWGPAGVVQDAKGNFFGTTEGGGHNDAGTIFEITSQYQYHILHSFDLNHGNAPLFGVTLASDGNLYGYGSEGWHDGGTLFESTPKGVYTELYSFQCCNEGYDPFGVPPFQGTDGLLYGTTLYGPGICCYGTIFTLENGISPLVETAPTGGKAGQQILILGNGLTGSASVTFNGVAAAFTVESDTYIKATVPAGATDRSGVCSHSVRNAEQLSAICRDEVAGSTHSCAALLAHLSRTFRPDLRFYSERMASSHAIGRAGILTLNLLKPRLMHSCATVVIPLHDCVVFVSTLNRAELICWFSEIAQTLDAITRS